VSLSVAVPRGRQSAANDLSSGESALTSARWNTATRRDDPLGSLDCRRATGRDEDAFDVAAVTRWLAEHTATGGTAIDLATTPRVGQFLGGATNLTYLLRYPDGDLVLRRPPRGTHHSSAHDMAREYRVQTQLCDVLPHVPHTIALCEDPAVIGTRS
jgi:hypothetical protein